MKSMPGIRMGLNIAAGASFVMAFGLISGCSKSAAPTPPQPQKAGQTGPAWTTTLKSTCTQGEATDCVGFYGFTADAEGNFKLGPTPANQTSSGKLKEEDASALATAMAPFVANSIAGTMTVETCENWEDVETDLTLYGADTVSLTRQAAQSEQLLSADLKKICQHLATPPQALTLYTELRKLAEKYYPTPFPDACVDAAMAVEALYSNLNLQACATAADCAYVAADFSIVPGEESQFVAEDNCSRIHPLVTGNAIMVASKVTALNQAQTHAEEVCGQRLWRSECLGVTGFLSNTGAALCDHNVCKRNPAAHPLY